MNNNIIRSNRIRVTGWLQMNDCNNNFWITMCWLHSITTFRALCTCLLKVFWNYDPFTISCNTFLLQILLSSNTINPDLTIDSLFCIVIFSLLIPIWYYKFHLLMLIIIVVICWLISLYQWLTNLSMIESDKLAVVLFEDVMFDRVIMNKLQ